MTPSERRIRTEVRYWAFAIMMVLSLSNIGRDGTWMSIVFPGVAAVLFLILVFTTGNDLKRLDAEAKQEEWT